jgi:hypothetical protein
VLLLVPAVLVAGAGATSLSTGASATPVRCQSGTHGPAGYAYAGHQAAASARGVRATISALPAPAVRHGHVAGWVGVGGPDSGPHGEDQWLQAGIAMLPGARPLLYVEVVRAGSAPVFRRLRLGVRPGERHRVAVVEVGGRPGWWRVLVDGRPALRPLQLPGSSGRWKPIVTAESWTGGAADCNAFAFRFEQVGVTQGAGGRWQSFAPGYRFEDPGFAVRPLASGRTFGFEALTRA